MRRALGILLAVLVLLGGAPTVARASTGGGDNPLAGHAWGVARSSSDLAWVAYQSQHGRKKRLLGRLALQPTNRWFGAWIADGDIEQRVRDYVRTSTGGDPDTIAMLTVFRMVPWEQDACRRLRDHRIRRLVVVEGEIIQGIFSARDAVDVLAEVGPGARPDATM